MRKQSQVEHCIAVVRRDLHRFARAFDGGFGTPLIVEQITEIVPSLRKCRIDPDCRVQCCLGFDIAAAGTEYVS
jgi:hypothetical protein